MKSKLSQREKQHKIANVNGAVKPKQSHYFIGIFGVNP